MEPRRKKMPDAVATAPASDSNQKTSNEPQNNDTASAVDLQRRGRPRSPGSMTNAQRQAKYWKAHVRVRVDDRIGSTVKALAESFGFFEVVEFLVCQRIEFHQIRTQNYSSAPVYLNR